MEVILIVLMIAFGLLAWKWGFDSREKMDSPEWERREHWSAFH